MKKKKGLNKYQKKQHRRGEDRLRGNDVEYYLSMAGSPDSRERALAMEHLCPCRVRKRISAVWEALYCGLQDPDLKVRKAAWHALDDGGHPNDPAFQPVLEKIAKQETHPRLRQRALNLIQSARRIEEQKAEFMGQGLHYLEGKCDWCGRTDVGVVHTYDTEIKVAGEPKRFGQICNDCNQSAR